MELKYMEIPEHHAAEYVKWYDVLDEFWQSGEPSALLEGVDGNKSVLSIRNAIKHRYRGKITAIVRVGKIYLRRDAELTDEEFIG